MKEKQVMTLDSCDICGEKPVVEKNLKNFDVKPISSCEHFHIEGSVFEFVKKPSDKKQCEN